MHNQVLAFCHIPKNAGSFITHILRSAFGPDHCRTVSTGEVYNYDDFKSDLKIYRSLRAISGHPLRPFSDFKEFEKRMVWAVLLRDPYSRFPSQYKWWCKQNHSHISFQEWCENKGEKFSNFQCKWIGGSSDHKTAMEFIKAKNIIVGFQSNIKGFLETIVQATGIEKLPWDDSLFVNVAAPNSSEYDRHLIERYNAEDILLYEALISHAQASQGERYDCFRSFKLCDKINYGLNIAKHVGLYKPYKKFTSGR